MDDLVIWMVWARKGKSAKLRSWWVLLKSKGTHMPSAVIFMMGRVSRGDGEGHEHIREL